MSPRRADETRICSVEGCGRKLQCRGWCNMHYQRVLNRGTTDARRLPSVDERFWSKVIPTGFCWEWRGFLNADGYGGFTGDGPRVKLAHRWAYEHLVGPIPRGLIIDHLCRNRACVNPDHLEPVTRAENNRRGFSGPATRAAWHEKYTVCKRGHDFVGDNIRIVAGRRRCKQCEQLRYQTLKESA